MKDDAQEELTIECVDRDLGNWVIRFRGELTTTLYGYDPWVALRLLERLNPDALDGKGAKD